MEFKNWLMDQFVEWERKQASRQTYSAFARYLDVKQPSLSGWLAGDYVPTGENLEKVANKLGLEVYDALGLPRPDSMLYDIEQAFSQDRLQTEESRIALVLAVLRQHGWKGDGE